MPLRVPSITSASAWAFRLQLPYRSVRIVRADAVDAERDEARDFGLAVRCPGVERQAAAPAVSDRLFVDSAEEDAHPLEAGTDCEINHLRPARQRFCCDQKGPRKARLHAAHRSERLREERPDHD